MKRGESVAVIYLSLLVCLALGQGTEGREPHSTTLVAHHTHICTTQTDKNTVTEIMNDIHITDKYKY